MPGRWNDKTVVRFDGFISDIYRGIRYSDISYNLYNSANIAINYCGAWILVDGGYLSWSCTICPLKETSSVKEKRWSKWAESMRKDVECTFGILKGRWRILKTGIRLHSIGVVDDIWFTCCAFHNMLLEVDGLDVRWKEGVRSPYEGELGLHEEGDVQRNVPIVFSRANNAISDLREYNAADNVQRLPTVYDEEIIHEDNHTNSNNIKNIKFITFRKALIEHFNQKWISHAVVWPSRNGVVEKN